MTGLPAELLEVANDMEVTNYLGTQGETLQIPKRGRMKQPKPPRKLSPAQEARLDKLILAQERLEWIALEEMVKAQAKKSTGKNGLVAIITSRELQGDKKSEQKPAWNILTAFVDMIVKLWPDCTYWAIDPSTTYILQKETGNSYYEQADWERHKIPTGGNAAMGVLLAKMILTADKVAVIGNDRNCEQAVALAKQFNKKVYKV